MRLILVRHAEAAPGEPDGMRALTDEGRRAAVDLGAELAAYSPEAVISSPLLRARETAASIAEASKLEAQTDVRLAPGAGVDNVRSAVSGQGDTVIVVGHQPDLADIVLELTGNRVTFKVGTFHEVSL